VSSRIGKIKRKKQKYNFHTKKVSVFIIIKKTRTFKRKSLKKTTFNYNGV